MNEKRYLKWYNKIGYGSGDIAGNVVYAFLTFFVMIYLTDTIGLNPGIIGTLMAVAKIFDGFSDVIFGSLIDKTHTKMGKARPWMLWPYLGCGACLFAIFAIPTSWGQTAQYAFFFIFYVMLNAGFYTANNIAYSALTALVTKNENERVQLGSLRFVFAFTTSTIIQAVTFGLVEHFGNDAAAWRIVALIYVIIGIISNTISVLSMKELPPDELDETENKNIQTATEKYSLREAASLLVKNKFYLLILGVYLLTQLYTAFTGVGTYYMTYVLGDANFDRLHAETGRDFCRSHDGGKIGLVDNGDISFVRARKQRLVLAVQRAQAVDDQQHRIGIFLRAARALHADGLDRLRRFALSGGIAQLCRYAAEADALYQEVI